jgi:2-polyprenyl-3-methyl-5-hydroxy-6-metoxy-1,4-benzoquinol methylase
LIYENVNIPLWRALKTLTGKRVLDIGCGTGALGELLKSNGNTVDGITYSHDEAKIAAGRINKVQVLDLNKHDAVDAAVQGTFDVLLFADVLEHLLDPLGTLRLFMKRLEKGGLVFVSLPNIACFYIRFGLMFGKFNMSKTGGILDETHLHHYTLKTAQEMLREAGLTVEKVDFVPAPSVWVYQTFLKKPEANGNQTAAPAKMADRGSFQFYEKRVYPVEHFFTAIWRRMFANQFVFVCRRAGE